jgi:NADPH2:quinone reductase
LEKLQLADAPDPVPGEGEVVVDLEFASLNPADRYLAYGAYPGQPRLPHVLGRDGVGAISAVGAGVTQCKVGQRVLIIRGDTGVSRWGTFAEKVAVSAQSIATPPAGWDARQSAAAPLVYLTGHQALTQWGTLPPSTVLVTGASGGVGIATIHLAKALGHTVVGLSRSEKKRGKLREIGADHVADPADPQWVAKLKKALAPGRVDLAVDNIGGPLFSQLLETLAPWGKVSVVGALAGPVPQFNTPSLLFRRLRVGGVALSAYTPVEARTAWETAVSLLQKSGRKPVIDQVFPFDKLPAAFERLSAGPLGKVLIQIRNLPADAVRSPS